MSISPSTEFFRFERSLVCQ